ncbi:OmpA family protein [Pseudaestuariivita sp.]|uniref:OmpA family protein n=1 Tax=Pseudaestuariivita sp. TaxID=2211669 RepID=UPI004059E382
MRGFLLPLALGALVLAACAPRGPIYSKFQSEAGTGIQRPDFGAATMNNMDVMANPEKYAEDLGARFASEVPSTITFAFNSSHLDHAAKDVLRAQAAWMRHFPEVRFRVYGHTDAVGSNSYNKRLGLRRAQNVVHFLGQNGISQSRLEALVSFGETRLAIPTSNRERQNRRTVTEVSGFVAGHPTVLNGQYAAIIYREYVASAVPASTLQSATGGGGGGGVEGSGAPASPSP